MGRGKNKWKISFYRSSSMVVSKPDNKVPPNEFLCPISGSLMADPVIVASGQTFERNCVQVCKKLGFTPILSDGSKPDFSAVIPNIAIKSTILNWCDNNGVEQSKPLQFDFAEKLVHTLMASQEKSQENLRVEGEKKKSVSENELLKGVTENPPVKFSYAATEVTHRPSYFNSSSEESITTMPLSLATRPSCYSSSSSSSSSSSENVSDGNVNPSSPEEEEIIVKLKSNQIFEQVEAVILLRKITKTNEEIRVSLCIPRLLSGLRPLLVSQYSVVQINAIAALVNLSLEKMNKVKIFRSGMVPLVIDALKEGYPEAQEHAAGALFSLSLADENKTAIGVLGALSPLLYMLRSESERARHDSALALYHLSLVQSNRIKLVKLGSVPILLGIVKSGELATRALLILCNLALCAEGHAALLDAHAVECFVGILRGTESESESTRENCVVGLYLLSRGSLRFKALANAAGAVEVLREVEERGSDRAREKAKKILEVMRGRDGGGAAEDDRAWESPLELGTVSRTGHRVGVGKGLAAGANSTDF